MSRSLPPLAAIRVFEAAARQASFTKAAAELGMTQAAVSYQIKVLEERVGAPLFLRGRRQIRLTESGRRLASDCTTALDLIASAFTVAQDTTAGVLAISAIPTFATRWLAGHLGEFQLAHPEIAVQLDSSRDLVDFDRTPFDVAFRAGDGHDPGLTMHRLVAVDVTPMLSPALIDRMGRAPRNPADLAEFPLINPTDPWWNLWFRHAGFEREGFDLDHGSKLGSQDLEAIAAISGHGVGLLTPFFYRDEVAAGRLVQPFDILCPIDRSYYLCYPEARRNVPKIRAFRQWIFRHFPHATDGFPSEALIG